MHSLAHEGVSVGLEERVKLGVEVVRGDEG